MLHRTIIALAALALSALSIQPSTVVLIAPLQAPQGIVHTDVSHAAH